MANRCLLTPETLKATIYLFFLATSLWYANSARILDEVDPQPPIINNLPQASNPALTTLPGTTGPSTTLPPSGQLPATGNGAANDDDDVDADPPIPDTEAPAADIAPVDDVAPVTSPATVAIPDPPQPQAEVPVVTNPIPAVGPTTTSSSGPAAATANSAIVANPAGSQNPPLSFFMHDILGGLHPSARVVAGIVASTDVNGLPFSKLNNNLFPITGGVPLANPQISGIINNDNLPFLAGLNGAQTSTVVQNSGSNNVVNGDNNQPFVSAGQLPSGFTLQKLMFGSITVVDDELTEGHELGSAVIGRAQGFYLASSLDGTSQSIVLTILLHNDDHNHDEVEDTISFFGVHRAVSQESQIAVIGGTGKYENVKGYATVETLHQEDQHTTDGVGHHPAFQCVPL
ncbi:Dirigent protein [Quillaja saponaria]|uniref:Dirigent protein n=1 Tax=Quillaja saponaria TaxID=32244 RepID=A0AAD7VHC5_QUISA|nr:Dirigent protein [Quillaja saponaria]